MDIQVQGTAKALDQCHRAASAILELVPSLVGQVCRDRPVNDALPIAWGPNDAKTWARVRGMIENYLTQKWREGALLGSTSRDAFFMRCGLGVAMSGQDVLEGRTIVEIGMAMVRPAEFIMLKFSHHLQTS